jgi:putative peptide zinc metalloprotease protein
MDIYKKISEKINSAPGQITIHPDVKALPNMSETNLKSAQSYPTILTKKDSQSILLEEHEAFVWQLLANNHSIKEITIKYYFKYKVIGTDYIKRLIKKWTQLGFIDSKIDIYTGIDTKLKLYSVTKYWSALLSDIFRKITFNIEYTRADRIYQKIYKTLSFLLNKKILILLSALSIIGIILSSYLNANVDLNTTPLANLAIILGINAIYLIIHESGHALVMKHFGLKIERVGFRIYLGYPVFYVDTTNAWMLPRKQRILISLAGVIANFLFAGVLGWISATIIGLFGLDNLLYWPLMGITYIIIIRMIFVNLYTIIINLVPFIEMDGYYILVDLLNEPDLRKKSINLVINLLQGKSISEYYSKFMLIFGLLSLLITTAFALYSWWMWSNLIL